MKKAILLILLSLAVYSCEEVIENPSLPYKEQLVICGVLEAGKPVSQIRITRTLPPLDRYQKDKALITDATAYIEYNGARYNLEYDSMSDFYYNNELTPVIGGVYRIFVSAGSLSADATTTVPDTVLIESFQLKRIIDYDQYSGENWYYQVHTLFKPAPGAVFTGLTYQYSGEPNSSYVDFAFRASDTLKSGRVSYPVIDMGFTWYTDSTEYINLINSMNYDCHIISWDEPFYDYFITRYEGSSDDEIFGTSGINIRGNINGGLGIFTGKSRTVKKIRL